MRFIPVCISTTVGLRNLCFYFHYKLLVLYWPSNTFLTPAMKLLIVSCILLSSSVFAEPVKFTKCPEQCEFSISFASHQTASFKFGEFCISVSEVIAEKASNILLTEVKFVQ